MAFIAAFLVFGLFWLVKGLALEPYVKTTLSTQGSTEQGERLFRINCAGCHGVSGQGHLGPNLQDVSKKRNEPQIIRQIIEGRTPPMPSFEMDTKSIADLLSYLHSIS